MTLGSLYSHALLLPTKSSKSKNQVANEQKSEVNQGPGFNPHWGNILSLDFFVFTK